MQLPATKLPDMGCLKKHTQNLFSFWSNKFHSGTRASTQSALLTTEIIFNVYMAKPPSTCVCVSSFTPANQHWFSHKGRTKWHGLYPHIPPFAYMKSDHLSVHLARKVIQMGGRRNQEWITGGSSLLSNRAWLVSSQPLL